MSVFVVTGKLGGGKTLAAVSRINDALAKGLKVATNLDLNVHHLPACSRRTKSTRVIRVPDHPKSDDIRQLGQGNPPGEYDESKFGLLVLDECGTWLNSRDWQADDRRELINLLLHIRKLGWHVYLIIQDISMLDKQARKSLAEHVVYCRRFDRIGIPVVSSLAAAFGVNLRAPKVHMALVKYGDQSNSLTVDRWFFSGRDLYQSYDTRQVFMPDYDSGNRSLLPPWHQFQHSFSEKGWRFYMRLTKIYLRKWSQSVLLAGGLVAGSVATYAITPERQALPVAEYESADGSQTLRQAIAAGTMPESVQDSGKAALPIHTATIESISTDARGAQTVIFNVNGVNYRVSELAQTGISASQVGTRIWRLYDGARYRDVSVWD